MALVIEDGTQVPTANSYVSLVDAQTYVDNFATVVLTDESLVEATRHTDAMHGHKYRGKLLGQPGVEQGLLFPRTLFTDSYGFEVAEGTIPVQLKNYVAQLAQLIVTAGGLSIYSDQQGVKSYSQSVDGVVSDSKEYFGPVDFKAQDEYLSILSPLLQSNTANGLTMYQRVL